VEELIESENSIDGFPAAGPMEHKFSGIATGDEPVTKVTERKTRDPNDHGMPADAF